MSLALDAVSVQSQIPAPHFDVPAKPDWSPDDFADPTREALQSEPHTWADWTDEPVPCPTSGPSVPKAAGFAAGRAGRPIPAFARQIDQLAAAFGWELGYQQYAAAWGESEGYSGCPFAYPANLKADFYPEFSAGWDKGYRRHWEEYTQRQKEAQTAYRVTDADVHPGGVC